MRFKKQNQKTKTMLSPHPFSEFEEAQQESGAQGPFTVDGQHWERSGLLTSTMPAKYLCVLK